MLKVIQFLVAVLKGIPKTPPDCGMLDSCVVENIILAIEPFVKALRIFETFLFINNVLYQKLILSLELQIKIDEWFSFSLVPVLYQISAS